MAGKRNVAPGRNKSPLSIPEASTSKSSRGLTEILKRFRKGRVSTLPILLAIALPILLALAWPRQLRSVEIERVPLSQMTQARFIKDFAAKQTVVITGAWPEEGWTPKDLVENCASAKIRTFQFQVGSKKWANHEQIGEVALQEYYDSQFDLSALNRTTPVLYGFEMSLASQCPRQLERMILPPFLTQDAFHVVTSKKGLGWPSVLMGPMGSQTGLHIDTHRLPFWIAVIGALDRPLKKFRVFPHDNQAILRYGRPAEGNNFHFDFDPWRPNLWPWGSPGVAEDVVYDTELRSGDLLYIPGGSPHSVINLADNLGVSMNFLDLKTFPSFVRACNKGSPLCGVVAGKGAGVLDALETRQKNEKSMSYYEFAGISNSAEFCDVHTSVNMTTLLPSSDSITSTLKAYCNDVGRHKRGRF